MLNQPVIFRICRLHERSRKDILKLEASCPGPHFSDTQTNPPDARSGRPASEPMQGCARTRRTMHGKSRERRRFCGSF